MSIAWITRDEALRAGSMEERVLLEQTPGYYPEFAAFLDQELARAGGNLFFKGASGAAYRIGKAAGDLQGIEFCVCVAAAAKKPSDETIDVDLWPLFEWLINGVGGEWTLEALRTTGAIYKVPGAPRDK